VEKGDLVTLASAALMHFAAKKDPENVPLQLRKLLLRNTHVSHNQVHGYKLKEMKIALVLVDTRVELVLHSVMMGTAVDEELMIAQLKPLLLHPTTRTHVSCH